MRRPRLRRGSSAASGAAARWERRTVRALPGGDRVRYRHWHRHRHRNDRRCPRARARGGGPFARQRSLAEGRADRRRHPRLRHAATSSRRRASTSSLNPASNAKLYTAAAALAILHGSHRYQTTLSGTIKSGASRGPRPARPRRSVAATRRICGRWSQELKAHGVKRVEGDIVVDQRFFDEQTTPPAFEQQPNEWAAFRAPVSAVAAQREHHHADRASAGRRAPAPASASIRPGFVDVEGTVKTSATAPTPSGSSSRRPAKAASASSAKISGAVGVGREARPLHEARRRSAASSPATRSTRSSRSSGVKVSGDVKLGAGGARARAPSSRVTSPSRSPTLLYAPRQEQRQLLRRDDLQVARRRGEEPPGEEPGRRGDRHELDREERPRRHRRRRQERLGPLRREPHHRAQHGEAPSLRLAGSGDAATEFVAQLSIGGVDGTLHKRFRDAARSIARVRAKTGTLDDAIALSGYVLGPPGKGTIAFAILFNKVSGRGGAARAAADKLVERVHERQWK